MKDDKLRLPLDQAALGGATAVRLFFWICHRCGAIAPTFDPKFPKPDGWVSSVKDEAGLPEVILCGDCASAEADAD